MKSQKCANSVKNQFKFEEQSSIPAYLETLRQYNKKGSENIVCCTSFDPIEKERIREIVLSLGGKYSENFTSESTVLVSALADTMKCKAAIYKNIPIVNKYWLYDSEKAGDFVTLENYPLPAFLGLGIYLHGFNETGKESLSKIINANEGEIVDNLFKPKKSKRTAYSQSEVSRATGKIINEKITHIIVSNSFLKEKKNMAKFLNQISKNGEIKVPIVNSDWIKDSVEAKICIDASKYDARISAKAKEQAADRDPNDSMFSTLFQTRQNFNLTERIQEYENFAANNPAGLFLVDCIVFFHEIEKLAELKAQRTLINLAGGLHFPKFNSSVTHVITKSISTVNSFKSDIDDYDNPPFIVDTNWLKDCIIMKKHLPEINYQPTRKGIQAKRNFSISLSQPNSLSGTGSLSLGISSLLFKDIKFGIKWESFSYDLGSDIEQMIISHSGQVYTGNKPKNNEESKSQLITGFNANSTTERIPSTCKYIIMNDGWHEWKGFRVDPNPQGQFIVSDRWIIESIRRKKIINVSQTRLLDLLPFPHKVPYPEFQSCVIEFSGFQFHEKDILKRVAKLMGAKIEFNLNLTTHLICERIDTKKAKTAKENGKIHLVTTEWLLECLERGKNIEASQFLFS